MRTHDNNIPYLRDFRTALRDAICVFKSFPHPHPHFFVHSHTFSSAPIPFHPRRTKNANSIFFLAAEIKRIVDEIIGAPLDLAISSGKICVRQPVKRERQRKHKSDERKRPADERNAHAARGENDEHDEANHRASSEEKPSFQRKRKGKIAVRQNARLRKPNHLPERIFGFARHPLRAIVIDEGLNPTQDASPRIYLSRSGIERSAFNAFLS